MTKNERIAALEAEVVELKARLAVLESKPEPWHFHFHSPIHQTTFYEQRWPYVPTYPAYPLNTGGGVLANT